MKLPPPLHPWRLSPAVAMRLQSRLAAHTRLTPLGFKPRWVAGLDAAFSQDDQWCLAAVVLWDTQTRSIAEVHTARRRLRFPYVPGLLSFREAPTLLAALRRLRKTPDVLMCDGHGLAHPRRFGLACHLGLASGLPSLGCAKSRLVGDEVSPGATRGSRRPLMFQGEWVGAVLRTRDRVRPVYVSAGHHLTLEEACQIVLACGGGARLPEPTRLADQFVAQFKREGGLDLNVA